LAAVPGCGLGLNHSLWALTAVSAFDPDEDTLIPVVAVDPHVDYVPDFNLSHLERGKTRLLSASQFEWKHLFKKEF